MVNQVGNPAMFEGNRFFPEIGTPIWKILRSKTVFELCDPDPFTVATWMLMSVMTRLCPSSPDDSRGTISVVAIPLPSLFLTGQPLPGTLSKWRVNWLPLYSQHANEKAAPIASIADSTSPCIYS